MGSFSDPVLARFNKTTSTTQSDLDPYVPGFAGASPLPEPSVRDVIRQNAPEPYTPEALGMDSTQSVLNEFDPVDYPQRPALPDSLKPKTTGHYVKDAAMSMIPIYGQARAYGEKQQESFDTQQYNWDVLQKQAIYKQQVEEQQKVLEAKMIQARNNEEFVSHMNAFRTLHPGATMEQIWQAGMKANPFFNADLVTIKYTDADGNPQEAQGTSDPYGNVRYVSNTGRPMSGRVGQDPSIIQVTKNPTAPPVNPYTQRGEALANPPTGVSREEMARIVGADPSKESWMDVTDSNGTIWLINKDTGEKKQTGLKGKTTNRAIITKDAKGNPITKIVPDIAGTEYARPDAAGRSTINPEQIKSYRAQLKQMADRLITERTAIAQRAKAAGMTLQAYMANLPDFRVYQDSRDFLGYMTAKLVESGRLSNQDALMAVKTLPDVFNDTLDSAKVKWAMGELLFSGGSAEDLTVGEEVPDQK